MNHEALFEYLEDDQPTTGSLRSHAA
jgi:hypothetical protein